MTQNLLDLSSEELGRLMAGLGQPAYRADQLAHALYRDAVGSLEEATTLPKALRAAISERFAHPPSRLVRETVDEPSETRKALLRLRDGEEIESVLMLYRDRRTVCVSTQAGCPVGCPFCATGYMGLRRNLSAGEIVEQVLHFDRLLKPQGQRVTHVVVMGMGEPLANFEATWRAIENLNHPKLGNLGARRITLSTSGHVPRIYELAARPIHVKLAVSLHAPNDGLRDRLVPLNRRWPLRELMEACRHYVNETGRRMTFEYVLIEDVNATDEIARELAGLLQGLLCHVNLIPLNPIDEYAGRRPSPEACRAFARRLQRRGISATIRLEKGIEIRAGCGQLQTKRQPEAAPA